MKIIGILISTLLLAVAGYYLFTGLGTERSIGGERIDTSEVAVLARDSSRSSNLASISTMFYLKTLDRDNFPSVSDVVIACTEAEERSDLREGVLLEVDVVSCGLSDYEMKDPLGGKYRVEVRDLDLERIYLYAAEDAKESEYYSNPKVY